MPTKPLANAVLATALLLAASCSDQEVTSPGRSPPRTTQSGEQLALSVSGLRLSISSMESIHRQLIRGVARALSDSSLRQAVYESLQRSEYPEHKLHFRTFLERASTSLLEDLSRTRNRTRDEVLRSLDSLPDLEFYMPVPEHRARWRGGDDLLVAGMLRDEVLPIAYDLAGEEVPIASAYTPPETPALVLVPAETDFSRPPARPNPSAAAAVVGGVPGLYMTSATIFDDYEPWPIGSPEFEIHIYQGVNGDAEDQDCIGESQLPPRTWNYDNPPHPWTGDVLVYPVEGTSTDSVILLVAEDDVDRCSGTDEGMPPRSTPNVGNMIIGLMGVVLNTGWAIEAFQDEEEKHYLQGAGHVLFAGLAAFILGYNFAVLDDIVGIAAIPNGCWPHAGPNTFQIIDPIDTTVVGALELEWRADSTTLHPMCAPPPPPPPPPPLSLWTSGPGVINSKGFYSWEAMPGGGSGNYSYQWSVYRVETGATEMLGTAKTQGMMVYAGSDFEMRVTVTSGVQQLADTTYVYNCIGKTGCVPA